MKVCIVLNSYLPALKYGGTERVMWYLAKELVEMGHQVTFLTRKGSTCPFAQIKEINPGQDIVQQIPIVTDIVHFNSLVSEDFKDKPYIVTLHGNKTKGILNKNTVFVSRNHAERHGSNSFVYNGLDWNDYGTVNLKATRDYYHFLGKAAWKVKNVKGAINVVKGLKNERLRVLGGYRLNFKMGFRFTLSPKVRFDGMIGGETKNSLLTHSKGLIFPVKWDEPFGLAITESLYFGAPVFGTPYGSLPELVHKEVGFLTDNESEMIRHLSQQPFYSAKICHEYAGDLFNSRVMAIEYLKKYETVLNGNTLNATNPQDVKGYNILPWYK